jgi:hypothetical protein
MVQELAFRGKVRAALCRVRNVDGHHLSHSDAVLFEPLRLRRIVTDQPDRADAEVKQDCRSDVVVPRIDRKPLCGVRIDGVEALVLELVGPDLVCQPNSTALVASEVHDHSGSPCRCLRRNCAARRVELLAAIALG